MDIALSRGIRSNLLTLQNIADDRATIQGRLATGKKVNSALDNPTNFFTAAGLNSRAKDLSNLLDGMSNGIKTLEAANNGLTSVTRTIESLQSTLRQARQDKSWKGQSMTYDTAASGAIGTAAAKNITFSGGAVGSTPVNIALNTADVAAVAHVDGSATGIATAATAANASTAVTINGVALTVNIASGDTAKQMGDKLKTAFDTAKALPANSGTLGTTTMAVDASGNISLTDTAKNVTVGGTDVGTGAGKYNLTASTGFVAGSAAVPGAVKALDTLVNDINTNASLKDKIKASNDGGKLRIENLSSSNDLKIEGAGSGGVNGATGASNTQTVAANDVRKNLMNQFNEQRSQLEKFVNDASYMGINLLKGDKMKLTFNETGTSTLDVQAKDAAGVATSIDNTKLGIDSILAGDFDSDTTIDTKLDKLGDAMTKVRSQSSAFGSNLSIVQNRTDFTKQMMNTLRGGADNLTLADQNEEGANLLSLNTRAQLTTSAMSFASQADQQVLQFLR